MTRCSMRQPFVRYYVHMPTKFNKFFATKIKTVWFPNRQNDVKHTRFWIHIILLLRRCSSQRCVIYSRKNSEVNFVLENGESIAGRFDHQNFRFKINLRVNWKILNV